MKNKGFTLIEMLIVIAIIAILSSVFLIGLKGFRGSAYDSRRLSDLQKVAGYIELYYNKNRVYPNVSTWKDLTADLQEIGINNVPNDPLYNDANGGPNYFYGVDSNDYQSYVLGAKLSDPDAKVLKEPNEVDGNVFGVDCNDPVYCVKF